MNYWRLSMYVWGFLATSNACLTVSALLVGEYGLCLDSLSSTITQVLIAYLCGGRAECSCSKRESLPTS
jgi:hypothetical protein